MAKYRFTLSIGFVGAQREEIVDIDDDATEEEVTAEWTEWAWNYIDGGPHKID